MGTVERAQRLEVVIDLPDGRIDPVSDAISQALDWAMARIVVHAEVDKRVFRGAITLRPRLSDAVIAALAAPGAVVMEAEGEGLPAGWIEAALRRES